MAASPPATTLNENLEEVKDNYGTVTKHSYNQYKS